MVRKTRPQSSRSAYSRWWLAAAFVAGVTTFAVVVIWRGFPWLMAVFSGAAVGALAFMTLQTAARVRAQFRRD